MNKIQGLFYKKARIDSEMNEIEDRLDRDYTKKSNKFLLDRKCHVCGEVVAEKDSVWCHKWDCTLEEDGMCECGLEAHRNCCSEFCSYWCECLDTKIE